MSDKHAHHARRGSRGKLESALRPRRYEPEEVKTSRWHRETLLARLLKAKRHVYLDVEQWDGLVAELLPDDEDAREARIATNWELCCDVFIERVEEALRYGRLSLSVDQWGRILELLFPEEFAEPAEKLDIPPPAEPAEESGHGVRLGRAALPVIVHASDVY